MDISAIIKAIIEIIKGIWGTSKVQDTTVVTPPADVEIPNEKSSDDMLRDCGL